MKIFCEDIFTHLAKLFSLQIGLQPHFLTQGTIPLVLAKSLSMLVCRLLCLLSFCSEFELVLNDKQSSQN